MSGGCTGSNPHLDAVLTYVYPPFSAPRGTDRIVAFGDHSHKCPVYLQRVPPCTAGCPAGEDVRGVNLLLTGVEKSDDAWKAAWLRLGLPVECRQSLSR